MAVFIFFSKITLLFSPLTKWFHAYTKCQVEHMHAHVHKIYLLTFLRQKAFAVSDISLVTT